MNSNKPSQPTQPGPLQSPPKEESLFYHGWVSREVIRKELTESRPTSAGFERMTNQQWEEEVMRTLGLDQKEYISSYDVRHAIKELKAKERTGTPQERWRAKVLREFLERRLK